MSASSQNPRWKQRPEGSNWGDFGPDDQLGRLNLLTPERVLSGVAEVREGRVFCLSLPLDYPGGSALAPLRKAPELAASVRPDELPYFNYPAGRDQAGMCDVGCDDAVTLYLQYSTQWDALAHMGQMFDADGDGVAEAVYYNGYRAEVHVCGPVRYGSDGTPETVRSGPNVEALAIDGMAAKGMQGRGVMIDLAHHFGTGRTLVNYEMLAQVLRDDDIVVEEGDLVCLRTGMDRAILSMNKQPDKAVIDRTGAVLDGRDPALLEWITRTGLVALISDNIAVEEFPPPAVASGHVRLPLHAHCLFKLGVHLGELWLLSDLAEWLREHKRSRFLLTAPPLRLPGAVGSPANAIATV